MTTPPISHEDFVKLVTGLHTYLYDNEATINVGVSALVAAMADVAITLDGREAALNMITRVQATLQEEVDRKWPVS